MRNDQVAAIVAKNVRTYRKQRGFTIEGLAEKVGIAAGHIGHVERASRVPSLEMLARIGKALDVSAATLLVDPASTSKDSLDQRLQAVIDALGREEKLDLLAILGQRHTGKELKALRVLLRA